MRYGVLAFVAAALAVPTVSAQGLWWVEGDRYCSDFTNRSRNSAMCGNPKKGETEPKPTLRYEFTTPSVPGIEDAQGKQGTLPAPSDRPSVGAPARGPQRQQ